MLKNRPRSASSPMADPPPVGGHTGATTLPMTRPSDWTFSANLFRSSSVESMSTWGALRKRSTPSNRTPSTSAAAVQSSMVSRSMKGSSASGPFPTTPGQPAL